MAPSPGPPESARVDGGIGRGKKGVWEVQFRLKAGKDNRVIDHLCCIRIAKQGREGRMVTRAEKFGEGLRRISTVFGQVNRGMIDSAESAEDQAEEISDLG